MRSIVLLLFWILTVKLHLSHAYSERECACTHDKVWLDVIILVDHSSNVEATELENVQKHILSVFGQTTIDSAKNQSVRVGVASFAKTVVSVADISRISSNKDLETAVLKISRNSLVSDVNTAIALSWATSNFALNDKRPNVKKVVILYSSAYSQGNVQDPMMAANQLKNSGITIITVAIKSAAWITLSLLASPNDGFILTASDINNEVMGALCRANCFCKNGFLRLINSSGHEFGECLATTTDVNSWVSASEDCSQWYKGAYLASEFSNFKHGFVVNLTKAHHLNSYFIGLHYSFNASKYFWQQPNGKSLALDNSLWHTGYPNITKGDCVKLVPFNKVDLQNMAWVNAPCVSEVSNYVCQMDTCDTDNYCATLNDYD